MYEDLKTLFALPIFIMGVTSVLGNYGEFLHQIRLHEMYHVLGPKVLLETFSNETNTEIISDGPCRRDLLTYIEGIKMDEIWALKMLDSSSKVPPGVLAGNIIELGMYDECMSVYMKKSDSKIRGNHCSYRINLSYRNKTLPINPLISICMPASCEEGDLDKIVHRRLWEIGGYGTFNITGTEMYCTEDYSRKWSGAIVVATMVSTIFIFLVICTILERLQWRTILGFRIPQFCREISLYRSTMHVFNLKDDQDSIPVLHGLRVISNIIIVSGHCALVRATGLHVNNLDLAYLSPSKLIPLPLVYYAVDTFMTISGFLMTYSFLKKYTSSKVKFNVGSYYLHRYIRLTPALAAILFVTIYIVPFIGSGPKWRTVTKTVISDSCEKILWTILLYVNNIFCKEESCLAHLWSTSADMQLFWISPIILYPLAKTPKLGLSILGILIVVSVAIPAVIIARNNFPFSIYGIEADFSLTLDMFVHLYTQTYNRASPWLIGILLGYLVITGPKELKRSTIFLGWLMTSLAMLFCIGGFLNLMTLDYEYNVTWETIFGSISRPIWSTAIAWIIFNSTRGYGGGVNKMLSSPIFLPLSRLSYCIYIVHVVVQLLMVQTARTTTYFTLSSLFITLGSDLVISLIVAYFFCIVFELPTRTLEKILFSQTARSYKSKKEVNEPFNENLLNHNKVKSGVKINSFNNVDFSKKRH